MFLTISILVKAKASQKNKWMQMKVPHWILGQTKEREQKDLVKRMRVEQTKEYKTNQQLYK